MSVASSPKKGIKKKRNFPWLYFLPSLSISDAISSSSNRVHVSLVDFQSCQYLPGECVFIVSCLDPSHGARRIGLGSVWPDRVLKEGQVQCGKIFARGQDVSEGPVLLLPIWTRYLPPKPVFRLFPRLDMQGVEDEDVHQSAIEALIKREEYLYPGIKVYYAPLSVYVSVHFETILSDETLQVPSQLQLASELANDEPCLPFDQMNEIINMTGQFPLYYPCHKSVTIWSSHESLGLTETVLSKQTLLQKLEMELKSTLVGLDSQIKEMTCIVGETLFGNAKDPNCSGILVSGPSGSGKSALVKGLVGFFENYQCGIAVHALDFSTHFDFEAQHSKVYTVFKKAKRQAPSVIIIEHIDGLTQDLRLLYYVLAQLEGLYYDGPKGKGVLVIGLTNRSQLVEDTFIKYNRLAVEIETILPDAKQKETILRQFFNQKSNRVYLSDVLLTKMVGKCVGFSGSDLIELGKEMKVQLEMQGKNESIESCMERMSLQRPVDSVEQVFLDAYKKVKPLSGATHEWTVEVPRVHWQEIGGQESIKQSLKEAVEWPLLYPERFIRMSIRPPKGLLLYGPPGNSKTLLAKALATESNCSFMAVKGPQLLNKWVGESEKALRSVFKKARAAAPTILFFDEIDAIAGRRGSDGSNSASGVGDRLLTQLLVELDGIQPLLKVVFIAATNRPDILDPALLRPGRLDRLVYVPMPDLSTRQEILRLQSLKMAFSSKIPWATIAVNTEGYSGAELVAVTQQAGIFAMEENLSASQIEERHLVQALDKLKPRTQAHLLAYYDKFRKQSRIQLEQ